MTTEVIIAACAACSTFVSFVGYELGMRRQRLLVQGVAGDTAERLERLESAARYQLSWSKNAEEEFDRIHARIEGVPKLGPYRAGAR